MKSARPVALVTGASSGFGYEFAKLLAADGYDLLIAARDQRSLERIARELRQSGVKVTVAVADLADPAAVDRLAKLANRQSVAILINNAGFGGFGRLVARDLATDRAMIRVNIEAVVSLTRLILPGMLKRRQGRILNVASTAAFWPGPLQSVYFASKAFVLSFSQAIATEVSGSGVTVTALCPGPAQTHFAAASGLEDSRLFRGRLADPVVIARAGYRAMLAGKGVVIPGRQSRLAAFVSRFLPWRVKAGLAYRAQDSDR